ncbi:RICIN domain-containing protein [Kineosporia sp. NBRC 101677]|uniref:RICIN domain-containing protein n=1 Tax=Kineosporia sp. NBRC 101677 TaxID=3032197 RepID=UPI0025525330|nr:RICIN domain-containing protein [Kineosporia sp. NBRC 101677]
MIRNVGTDMCVDLPFFQAVARGTPVTQYPCAPGDQDNHGYTLIRTRQGMMLGNVKSQLCLDVPGQETVPEGTPVIIYDCLPGPTDNQMFDARKRFGDGRRLLNIRSGLCLDVSPEHGGAYRENQQLLLARCTASPTQAWTIQPGSS